MLFIKNKKIKSFNNLRLIRGMTFFTFIILAAPLRSWADLDYASQQVDLSISKYDGPGIGTNRECSINKDCTQTRNCTFKKNHDTRNCKACIVKNPFGGCVIRGNDPVCEVTKASQNSIYDAQYAARKGDCERLKSSAKLFCEANKAARKIDCERVKSSQMLAGEVAEALIHESKKQVKSSAVLIPEFIKERLKPFFNRNILDNVRWTTNRGNVFSVIAKGGIELEGALAVTLDNIVVFKNQESALYDVGLWAHELEHVMQYQELGIDHFAEYYADYALNSRLLILRNFPFFTDGFNSVDYQEPNALTCPHSFLCNSYIKGMINKIEALASAQSVYVCSKLDPIASYMQKGIYDDNGTIIKEDHVACRPSFYSFDN